MFCAIYYGLECKGKSNKAQKPMNNVPYSLTLVAITNDPQWFSFIPYGLLTTSCDATRVIQHARVSLVTFA